MRFPARILGIILVLTIGLFFVESTLAQTSFPEQSPIQQFETPNNDSNVPPNLHTWTQSVVLELVSAMACQLTGINAINPKEQCLGIDQQTGKLGYTNNTGGVIGMVTNLTASLYTVPIRFGDYIAYVSDNFGVAKQAQAQGAPPVRTGQLGFDALLPVLNLWSTFRDLSYLMFVLVFIVIGFAIMLRVNIDARTVMTIQNQIPKLIIGIILVTFSYAIAGFLIDMMWISNYVIISTIAPDTTLVQSEIITNTGQGAPGFVNYIFEPTGGGLNLGGSVAVAAGASNEIRAIIENMFNPNTDKNMGISPTGQPGSCFLGPVCTVVSIITNPLQILSDVITDILSWVIFALVNIAAFLIIAIAILWAMIKLWFSLLKAYIFILIDVVIAPFWIVAGIFPKAPPSLGFGSWLRDLVANLAVFPAVVALFMFGRAVYDGFNQGNLGAGTTFNPPLLGNTGGINPLGPLIALGVILMAPNVADMIKKAVKASSVPTGFGALSMGTAAVGGFVGGAYSNLMKRDQQGNAVGRGAVWMDRRIKNPVVRSVMGWNYRPTENVQGGLEKRTGSIEAKPKAEPESGKPSEPPKEPSA